MNKTELIAAVAEKTGDTKAKAEQVVSAVFDVIQEALQRSDEVKIPGFGAFDTLARKGGEGRNPQTGAKVMIKASVRPRFRAGKGLKDALNAGGAKKAPAKKK
jgi:DNA-binding protein HU-beta